MYRTPAVGIRSRSAKGFSSRKAVESGGGVSSAFFLAKTPKAANWSRIRALSNGEQRGEAGFGANRARPHFSDGQRQTPTGRSFERERSIDRPPLSLHCLLDHIVHFETYLHPPHPHNSVRKSTSQLLASVYISFQCCIIPSALVLPSPP